MLGILGFFLRLRMVTAQRDKARQKAAAAASEAKFHKKLDESHTEIDQEFSHRAEEAAKDIKDGKIPRNLSNPNDY